MQCRTFLYFALFIHKKQKKQKKCTPEQTNCWPLVKTPLASAYFTFGLLVLQLKLPVPAIMQVVFNNQNWGHGGTCYCVGPMGFFGLKCRPMCTHNCSKPFLGLEHVAPKEQILLASPNLTGEPPILTCREWRSGDGCSIKAGYCAVQPVSVTCFC